VSPLTIDLGVDVQVVDEPTVAAPPTATDTMFLIHTVAGSASPQTTQVITNNAQAKATYPNEADIQAISDAFFNIGGGRMIVCPQLAGDATPAVSAAARITPQMGPGQVVVPEVTTATNLTALRDWCWDNNRILIANPPDGANVAACQTFQAALTDASKSKFTEIEADTILIPGLAPGTTRDVRASVIKAALMARSDIATGNPNLAAAGNHTPGAAGQVGYAVGIKAEHTGAEQDTLAASQVNCFRTVNGQVRAYGDFTAVNLATLPQWWNVSGSRTIMALRALEQAAAEELVFGQVAGDGLFLDRYYGALAGVCADLQRKGAIYGNDQRPGYSVDVSPAVNPLANIAQGIVTGSIKVKTSPSAVDLEITIVRRQLTQEV
jgi:hypothetical protein